MNWLHTLWFGYFWLSIKTNGPEALCQTVVYGAIAMAVYPPLRKWAKGETAHLHAKLNHIVNHSDDIPPFDAAKHGFEAK